MAGGVVDGQAVAASVVNPAFIAKNSDDATSSNLGVTSSNPASGSSVTNIQREHNAHASVIGITVGQVYNYLWTWASNIVGTSSDSIIARIQAIVLLFKGTGGHAHSGVDGDGSQVSAGNLTGTLGLTHGGTGQTTQQTALDAIAGATTSGQYLRGNGSHVVLAAIQAADVPTLNQNTTGTASNITAGSNSTLTTLSALSLPVGQLTGTLGVGAGGTGQTSASAAINALVPSQTGNNGLVLTTNGSAVSWQAAGSGSFRAPNIAVWTTGSGVTYNPTAGALYLRVQIVGGGGGGGPSQGGTIVAAGNGAATTFGSILTASGGSGGASSPGAGGSGGGTTPSGGGSFTGGLLIAAVTGGAGGPSMAGSASYSGVGSSGGSSYYGGAGAGGIYGSPASSGTAATGYGSGGGGSGGNSAGPFDSGSGGGAGGYVEAIITTILSSYSITVGGHGSGGTSSSGRNGGDGKDGYVVVTEYFQ